jgi:hypothetical protein
MRVVAQGEALRCTRVPQPNDANGNGTANERPIVQFALFALLSELTCRFVVVDRRSRLSGVRSARVRAKVPNFRYEVSA